PGLSTYIKDGETGLLVRTGDAQDLAEAIEYLWKNPDKAEAIGSRAREWAVSHYAMDKWLHDVTQVLESA
ncbi:MAG: glycosyltransferase, partial [Anaerolineae bacterium]|nr:glycosyltransferase [Anaerolineae bacterium]